MLSHHSLRCLEFFYLRNLFNEKLNLNWLRGRGVRSFQNLGEKVCVGAYLCQNSIGLWRQPYMYNSDSLFTCCWTCLLVSDFSRKHITKIFRQKQRKTSQKPKEKCLCAYSLQRNQWTGIPLMTIKNTMRWFKGRGRGIRSPRASTPLPSSQCFLTLPPIDSAKNAIYPSLYIYMYNVYKTTKSTRSPHLSFLLLHSWNKRRERKKTTPGEQRAVNRRKELKENKPRQKSMQYKTETMYTDIYLCPGRQPGCRRWWPVSASLAAWLGPVKSKVGKFWKRDFLPPPHTHTLFLSHFFHCSWRSKTKKTKNSKNWSRRAMT